MIEFKGNVSKRCQKYISGLEGKMGLRGSSIAVLLIMIPATVLVAVYMPTIRFLVIIAGILFSAFFLFMVYYSPFMKSTFPMILPTRVVISDDGYITSYGDKFELTNPIDTVAVVIDCGEWYHISWNRKVGFGPERFICQKDLLTHGTIEEFEKLFEGKIVQKHKK